jgi:hypothetical protein
MARGAPTCQGKRHVDGRSSFVGTNLKPPTELPHPFPHTCDSHAHFGARRIQAAESFLIHSFAVVSNFQLESIGVPVKPHPSG